MKPSRVLSLLVCTLAACAPAVIPAQAPAAPTEKEKPAEALVPRAPVFVLGGFETPESVLYDPEQDCYLVSNVEGSLMARDGNGFISKVSPDGEMLEPHFIRGEIEGHGLSAPKGMAISGEKLYVADVDRVLVFHRATGAFEREVVIPEASFLNDVTVGLDGEIYVSDSGLVLGREGFSASGSDAIYVLHEGVSPRALVKDPSLGRPSGLLATDEGLWVITFGTGELYRVDREGGIHDRRTLAHGTLDGIVALGDGRVAISSWEAEGVLVGDLRGPFTLAIAGVGSPADVGWDGSRGRVLVPLFTKGELRAYVVD